jgi:alpha-N-acetylglucosamine transferase
MGIEQRTGDLYLLLKFNSLSAPNKDQMANETESSRKEILLKGRENYLAWSTRLKTMLTIDDIIERTNDSLVISGAEKQKNEKIAKKYVIKNLSDEVMHTISPSDSFIKLLELTLTKTLLSKTKSIP